MARRKITFTQGEYYHVYNRGVNRQPIFRCEDNYVFLLRRVKRYIAQWHIVVIAYCLMPNHYHFVLLQAGEHPISRFMQSLFNSYTKAFNKMFDRSGTLFEGPFRAAHVNDDAYLLHLCRYVHRNPLEAGLVSDLREWPYANYLEWIGQRGGTLVDREFVKSHFSKPEEYVRFVADGAPPEEIADAIRQLEA
jgi:REP element-mobilizing transposase RayT